MSIKREYIEAAHDVSITDVVSGLYDGTLSRRGRGSVCCCPFHAEKTPSFFMSADRNTYHCFGCGKGGDTISFVMEYGGKTFEEAVRHILARHRPDINLADITEKRSKEEERAYKERETLYAYNHYAHEYFREQYLANNEESLACRRYAERSDGSVSGHPSNGRWDTEFCSVCELGYSPRKGNGLIEHAKKKGLLLATLCKLGLIVRRDNASDDAEDAGNYYDFFRGRLTIPQRDRSGRIVTFTARLLEAKKGDAKYLNTKDTPVYSKSSSVFGIDVAYAAARKSGTVYLVEGAPDVLRLQSLGISNAVATLGGSWSEKQIEQFKAFSPVLTFIPDSDVPKEGERIGTGEKFVMKNGRLALSLGFHVRVRSIPNKGERKEDVDSYVTCEERWSTLEEQEFAAWYASRVYDSKADISEQTRQMSDICDVLVLVSDETLRKKLLADIKATYKQGRVWQTALNEACSRRQSKMRDIAAKHSSEELQGFNFYRTGNHYYAIDSNGKEQRWTNFIIKPLFLIKNNGKASRIFELTNEDGRHVITELAQRDVTRLDNFRERIEGEGDFHFVVKPDQYEHFKEFMYKGVEMAQRINQMGWNVVGGEGFFAFANGVVYDGEWKPVDSYGIVRLNEANLFLPAYSSMYPDSRRMFGAERKFTYRPGKGLTKEQYFDKLVEVYGDNARVGIAYYLATLFRDIIYSSTNSFPMLFVYGKRGTGKTEFANSLTLLFQDPELSNLASTSLYAMGEKLAQVSNGLVHFDEYKNSLTKERIDILKGTYNSSGRTKKSSTGDTREQTFVDCGVIVTGQEMPTADIALFERTIFLEAMKSERTQEETDNFQRLLEMRKQFPSSITVALVSFRAAFQEQWPEAWREATATLKHNIDYAKPSERLFNNWAMIYGVVLCAERIGLVLPFNASEIFELVVRMICSQTNKSTSTDELALFWNTFANARAAGEICEKQDYKIEFRTQPLKIAKGRKYEVVEMSDGGQNLLYLRPTQCIGKVSIQTRKEGRENVPQETLISYLMSSPEFIGKNNATMRFNVLDKAGRVIKEPVYENGQVVRWNVCQDQDRPLVFDYDLLVKNREIDLHRVVYPSASADDDDNTEVTAAVAVPDLPLPSPPSDELPF